MGKPRRQGRAKRPADAALATAWTTASPEAAAPGSAAPGTAPGSDWAPAPPARGTSSPEDARPSVGADKRSLDRISQRELGKVDFDLRTPGGGWVKARLWDFSSIGFGVLLEPWHAGRDPILAEDRGAVAASLPLSEGDDVRIRIRVQAHASFETWCTVMNVTPWRGAFKVGLRRLDVGLPKEVGGERRASPRLSLSPALGLAARIRNPFLYGHWSLLRVTDVSRDLGFAFVSDDPSALLFEGMEIRIHFDLACFRSMPILARVTWVFATQESELRFGVECLSMDWRLQAGLWDYLLYSGQWTPAKLREAGFRSNRVKGRLRFRTVKTMEDYAEVLLLRRDAYVSAGKRPESTQPEDMASPLDGISRILIARHHGLLVGSMTFTFPASEETLLDSQEGFPGGKYPVAIPPKANLIEVSRLCIREDYRGTDLLQGLFEHGLKHVLMSDRHWLITSATAELLPLYERIGFRRLMASYRHPLLGYREHHLIIAHRNAFLSGFRVGLLTWNSIFGDLVAHLIRSRLVTPPRWIRAVIRLKLLARPLAAWLMDAKARAGFRKHMETLKANRRRALEAPEPNLSTDPEVDAPMSPEKEMGT